MIDKQRIAEELEKYIEWDGEDRRYITTASTLLFAEHIAKLAWTESAGKLDKLRTAIVKTLDDNAHLADGENCTLLPLKVALRETGEPWAGDIE